jgi:hypothetical protein
MAAGARKSGYLDMSHHQEKQYDLFEHGYPEGRLMHPAPLPGRFYSVSLVIEDLGNPNLKTAVSGLSKRIS